MVSSIRVALLPVVVTIISSTITYLTNLTTTNPSAAVVINAAVLILTYADSYLTAQEKENAAPSPSNNNPNPQLAHSASRIIKVTPLSFACISNPTLAIEGSGFTAGGKVSVTADNMQLGIVVADASGKFSLLAAYLITQSEVSALANAVQDSQEAGDTFISVSAYDYGTDEASNEVDVAFS